MKYIIILMLLLSNQSFSSNVNTGDNITAKRFNESTLTVGSIQQSLLTEAQFQSLQGNCWVKMIGQDVTGSDYASLTGNTNLPDARDKFLRQSRLSSETNLDAPLLGQIQEDQFQGHFHSANGAGDNVFLYQRGTGGVYGALPGGSWGDRTSIPAGNAVTDGINGVPRVGSETRPKNLGINFFIKINYECN